MSALAKRLPNELTSEKARDMLAGLVQCETPEEVKSFIDVAETMLEFYKRQGEAGKQSAIHAAELVRRSEREAGKLLKAVEKAPPGRKKEIGSQAEPISPDAPPTLEDRKITKKQSHQWQRMASVPEEKFEDELKKSASDGKPATAAAILRLVPKEDTVPPKRKKKPSPVLVEFDAKVKRLIEKEHLGGNEIAAKLNCEIHKVNAAKRRLGFTGQRKNPLENLTKYAVEFSDTWHMAMLNSSRLWEEATQEEVCALVRELEALAGKTGEFIKRLKKEAKRKSK